MRRLFIICAFCAALAVPAAALGVAAAPGDAGTLVVKDGSAPKGTAVATLVIRGAAIGQITGSGKILISDETPDDGYTFEVTGSDWHKEIDTGTLYRGAGPDFRFRAVGGLYKITIYGSGVDLVASGRGTVFLTGSPEAPARDGVYSLNGGDFKSLPALTTRQLTIGG
jgi:hypothetical protein